MIRKESEKHQENSRKKEDKYRNKNIKHIKILKII
jgi:hypothetical protein